MANNILNWLGLAQRSGNLVTGEDTCIYYIKKNTIKLLIVPKDASLRTQKKFEDIAQQNNILFIIYGYKNNLSEAIGKSNRTVYGIKDQAFAEKIYCLIKEYENSLNN